MNRNAMIPVVAIGAAVLMGPFLHAAEPATEKTPAIARYERMRYGMFVHFGMNTFIDIDQFETRMAISGWRHAFRPAPKAP